MGDGGRGPVERRCRPEDGGGGVGPVERGCLPGDEDGGGDVDPVERRCLPGGGVVDPVERRCLPGDAGVGPVERRRPPDDADERTTLTGLLDFLRATVVAKVAGLTDEQAFAAPVAPSTLTPAGVVQHLTGTERFWFSIDFAGADVPWPWPDEDPHGGFEIAPGATLARIVADYVAECERSRQVVAGHGLDDRAMGEGMTFNLRHALAHMVEETARHCGHLDLLRERIDGTVGM